jgi:hypothetical protein
LHRISSIKFAKVAEAELQVAASFAMRIYRASFVRWRTETRQYFAVPLIPNPSEAPRHRPSLKESELTIESCTQVQILTQSPHQFLRLA